MAGRDLDGGRLRAGHVARAAFTYSPTGNIWTVRVETPGGEPLGETMSRDVEYRYEGIDPQAVTHIVEKDTDVPWALLSYDLAGHMVTRELLGLSDEMTLVWDGEDQLREISRWGAHEAYLYDHEGQRVLALSEADGVKLWFGESETHFRDGEPIRRHFHLSDGGSTVARITKEPTATRLELQYADALQNLMLSLDHQGEVTASFLYSPFGEVLASTGDADHRRQFNGKESDRLSGLRYYGFRYYDPVILRWNSGDPLLRFAPDSELTDPQEQNIYQFSLNNPLVYYDPDGRSTAVEAARPVVEISKEALSSPTFRLPLIVPAETFNRQLYGDCRFNDTACVPEMYRKTERYLDLELPETPSERLNPVRVIPKEKPKLTEPVIPGMRTEETQKSEPRRLKAKERRANERARSKEEKHGDPEWKEPAPEDYAKWRAGQAERTRGRTLAGRGMTRKGVAKAIARSGN